MAFLFTVISFFVWCVCLYTGALNFSRTHTSGNEVAQCLCFKRYKKFKHRFCIVYVAVRIKRAEFERRSKASKRWQGIWTNSLRCCMRQINTLCCSRRLKMNVHLSIWAFKTRCIISSGRNSIDENEKKVCFHFFFSSLPDIILCSGISTFKNVSSFKPMG